MSNDNFRRDLNNAFDEMSGAPSSNLRNRVRSAVAEAPTPRSAYWIAAIAAVMITAVIVGALYVANPLRRPGTVGIGNPTASPSVPPSPQPSPSPSASPSASPSGAAYICTADTLPQGSPKASPIAYVNRAQVAQHDSEGYERIVIQFSNGFPTESVVVSPQTGTSFSQTASGQSVVLKGSNGILVSIHGADMHTSYRGQTDWVLGLKRIAEVRTIEDFDGVINIAVGISGPACYHAYYLQNPSRLVIDVQFSAA